MTGPTARLLHLSDIHFGRENREALEAVATFAARIRPDAVIVAGDLTQKGRKSEFAAARDWLTGLGIQVIAAPGNHDTPLLHLPARAVRPFRRYEKYLDGMDAVGKLIELAGGQVRIAALNTARGVQGRLNWADGVIDLEDLDASLKLLAEGPETAWRLLICHHPLDEPGLSQVAVDTRRGGEALRRCAAAHVDAIFTGHIHDAFAHAIGTTRRPMVQMGSGTLSTRLRATQPSFCVVQIEGDRMTQDVLTIDPNGLTMRRGYDSLL